MPQKLQKLQLLQAQQGQAGVQQRLTTSGQCRSSSQPTTRRRGDHLVLIPAPGTTVADTIAATTHAVDQAQPLTFLEHVGNDDAYRRGTVLFVLPGLWTGMPADLLATVRARRTCAVTGRCPICSACLQLAAGQFAHERRCPVADDKLRPALARWGRQVGPARGQRIRETP